MSFLTRPRLAISIFLVSIALTKTTLAIDEINSVTQTAILGKETHGGKAVVCRSIDGEIKQAELLDLFEARLQYEFIIPDIQESFYKQYEAKSKLLNFYWGRKVEIRDDVFKWFKPIPAGVRLVPSDDALPVFIPEGCKIEQAASFVNEGNIFYDTEIWQKLSATNQAALILHEIVYLEDRLTGAIDSRNARYMVGLLFSDQTLTPVTDGLSRETFRCETDSAENSPGSKQTSFDFYVDSYGKRIAQFDAIAGLKMIEKMTIESFFEADSFPQLKHPIISSARSYQISSANRPFFELYISVLKSKSGSIFNDVTVKVRKSPIPETLQEETPMKCFKYTRAGI